MEDQAEPESWFRLGVERLRKGQPHESLAAYAAGVSIARIENLEAALRELEQLPPDTILEPGREWARRLLRVAQMVRDPRSVPRLGISRDVEIESAGSFVIIAGGTAAVEAKRIEKYRRFLVEGFRDYGGTIISGGTPAGIAGLVGELQVIYGDQLFTIGYLPSVIAPDVEIDNRYRELRRTSGYGFSPLESIQYWTDLVFAGVATGDVGLLGINGGAIAHVEFRLVLALGARVAIVAGSGRAADELLADPTWTNAIGLTPLADEASALRAWLALGAGG